MVLKNVCFVFSIKPQVSRGICPAKTIKQETLAPYLAAEISKSGNIGDGSPFRKKSLHFCLFSIKITHLI